MKKNVLFLVVLLISSMLYAQNTEYSDDIEDLFNDVTDIEVDSVTPATGSVQAAASPASKITLNGSSKFVGGAAVFYNNGSYSLTPAATFSTTIDFAARVDENASVHGSVTTGYPGKLDFTLSSVYVHALLGNTWITAGKKSTTWGNSRIFSGANSTLASDLGMKTVVLSDRNPNLVSDSGNGFSMLLRRPILKGELALLGYTQKNQASSLQDLNAAFCYDTNLGLTGISIIGRWYEDSRIQKVPVLALEQKRTIANFDVYAQEQMQIDMGKTLLTAGLYRIWETKPRMAVNVEVQDLWSRADDIHQVRIGVDAGMSRLGKKKTGKIAFSGFHDFNGNTGQVSVGYIRSNLFPHTTLTTGVTTEYDFSSPNDRMRGMTAVALLTYSLTY